ncbi:MAG: hypothetical protein Q4F58_00050 [Candidatus Saccharibacteria bacterium]|nr:hypothetical protein [Candidatus Saccharibacteria bacterium]
MKIRSKIVGGFFAIILMLSSLLGITPVLTESAYAEPAGTTTTTTCEDSLGSLGWLVCPGTGKISEAVDFLYDKIEGVLEINPVEMKDGSPIYEIWKYFQGVTNILFVLFLLVVVFSQITGVGITNYGVKKALPKLIIAAVLVNLSFYICSLAVDVSNIFGDGIRGLFESIAESTSGGGAGVSSVQLSEMYLAMSSGTAFAAAGVAVAFETGAIWMLIPLALGALVSVVIGLITIAMRQAVVTLLIMIAPLAMVAYILPNTEQWFKKWKQMLFQMLIFYPAFSLLFGASSVAGWAIIISSDNGFGVLIGVAVQIFPLFFSWSLMKMSGTVLGTINSKLTALTNKPLGGVRDWATSHQQLSKQKHLASPNAYTPSLRLQQFLSDRKIARDEETKEHAETVKNRGLAYAALRNYRRGTDIPSKEGEESYEAQARNAEYMRIIERHKNNMNKGLGQLEAVKQNGTLAQRARLDALDAQNVMAFDTLKMEQARGEMIDYDNATGYHTRMEDAMNAHMDNRHAWSVDPNTGKPVANTSYKRHFDTNNADKAKRNAALARESQANARYADLSKIMEGKTSYEHYAVATAAHGYSTQSKIISTKMQNYFDLTPPTNDLTYRLDELTTNKDAAANIDAIVSGLKTLNMRGDTDLVQRQINNMLDKDIGGGIQLGTHASQSLASFLMFDVKDSDPFLRRFGKYINLETANVYNANKRKNLELTYDEYIKGYHNEIDEITGETIKMYAKKGMKELMEGTSLDNVERTAFSNFDESLMKAYTYAEGSGDDKRTYFDVDGYLKKREEVQTAIGPQFISASLKYLSGSEQLTSAVKFITGYGRVQKKDKNGRIMVGDDGEPIYEWKPVWEKYEGEDLGNSKKIHNKYDVERIREYFQKKALQYVTDQTPTQILGMRSDYYAPMLEHLAKAYEEQEEMKGWTDEEILEHEEYMKELSDIQTRYGDLPPEIAKQKREEDKAKLKNKLAGAQFRQLLNSRGKLNQIYRTRRSGAANNAKDWMRGWLDLDNDVAITMKLEKDKRKEKAEFEKAKKEKYGDQPDTENSSAGSVYTEVDRAGFVLDIENLWHDLRSEDDDVFYEESLEYLKKNLGRDSFIVKQYEDFRRIDPTAESHDMEEFLKDLLNDPENY